jgi:hypothetical protein
MVRLAKARSPDIPFRAGDAQRLDFADGSFDAVVMNFGVLHVSKGPDVMSIDGIYEGENDFAARHLIFKNSRRA